MNEQLITGKMLQARGWPEGKVIGLAKSAAMMLQAEGLEREVVLDKLDEVKAAPGAWLADPQFGDVARELMRRERNETSRVADILKDAPLAFQTWGAEGIDAGAVEQMNTAMRLPVAVAGALMPDAHIGYGLPIGGVLATKDAVVPYAVGVDIACRMRLSVYEVSPHLLGQQKARFEKSLQEGTKFGSGRKWTGKERHEHPVLDEDTWKATRLLKGLQFKAAEQLGTSGSGNHFVEWGAFELEADAPDLGLKAGQYLSLLSHSGSRGVGFKIAGEYTRIAKDLHSKLPPEARNLAWLDLDSEAGAEYWLSMELAGRFASANHAVIHRRVADLCGLKEASHVENHHNFAWREQVNGEEAIVHRKGATPAGVGVLGVIPGSMADPGFVVKGRGVEASLSSASHGAGRKMGRKAAINALTGLMRDRYLQERGVTRLGGGLDEAPQAYKDIETVIEAQRDLVEVLGKFSPRIVKMADEPGDV